MRWARGSAGRADQLVESNRAMFGKYLGAFVFLYLCISCLSVCICICISGVFVYSHQLGEVDQRQYRQRGGISGESNRAMFGKYLGAFVFLYFRICICRGEELGERVIGQCLESTSSHPLLSF